ncbi:hypothetical protein [Methylobacterium sp. J-067]|uniref:hypothetical protein n=1 Tax=Methylobacterium sp. J-067 TaxID=2836648 RepID=UPI001FB9342E|nr:hypothetical protein [Methylobacterium sp. J-067]MCJ2026844.1 hypothetical protein [Methylobacterium sp. J-067]
MRTIIILASSAIAAATFAAGIASADDRINVTPPISREHAREIRAIHPAGEFTVTPQPVPTTETPRPFSAAASRIDVANR